MCPDNAISEIQVLVIQMSTAFLKVKISLGIAYNGQVLPMVGNFIFRPPGTAAWLFDKVKY